MIIEHAENVLGKSKTWGVYTRNPNAKPDQVLTGPTLILTGPEVEAKLIGRIMSYYAPDCLSHDVKEIADGTLPETTVARTTQMQLRYLSALGMTKATW